MLMLFLGCHVSSVVELLPRASPYEESTVVLLAADTLMCGYSTDQLKRMHLDDSYIQ